jgi:anaerobic selenocysteine-containing dehydrogenase
MKFRKLPNGQKSIPQESILNILLRINGQPGFKKLVNAEHGKLQPDHKEDFLGRRVFTDNKKVDLAPTALMERSSILDEVFKKEAGNKSFKLITKRAVQTHNSWTHNIDRMIKGTENTNFLYLNPKDAEQLDLKPGDFADVTSANATIRVPIKCIDELMRGTVALPHGWGHQHAKGLSVANKTNGVNVNILASSGQDQIDPLSGMSRLTALEVKIEASKGERAHTWSGLPDRVSS